MVCGPAESSSDELSVELLGPDGCRCVAPLASLEPRGACALGALAVGDLVRASESDGFGADGPVAGTPGLVLQTDGDEAVVVRFPALEGFKDVVYTPRQAEEQLMRDEELNGIQPGRPVRLRGQAQGPQEVGVVYALHGDATAVVDFLHSWGHHCSVLELELAEERTRTNGNWTRNH